VSGLYLAFKYSLVFAGKAVGVLHSCMTMPTIHRHYYLCTTSRQFHIPVMLCMIQ